MGKPLRNLVLVRDVEGAFPLLARIDDFACVPVHHSRGDEFIAVEAFCAANGFPTDWPRRMLERGALGWIMITSGGEVAATAWITRSPFYVEEIRRTFDPGPDGDYYFGDFTAPSFRGRRLHRHLIQQRLEASRGAGRRWATAMTLSTNGASLSGYEALGFAVGSELRTRRRAGWQLDSIHSISAEQPASAFSSEGFLIPGVGRLRRAR